MLNLLRTRSMAKEYLDEEDIPVQDLYRNLHELNIINRFLGGHNITRTGAKALLRGRTLHIAEIGSGGGDNLACLRSLKPASLTGFDYKADCVSFATKRYPDIRFVCADYRGAPPTDIFFSSLFCHHFSREELIAQLQWLKKHSRVGFFINDLHRHPLAWISIRLLTALFSRSRLVKHDAPLSVARGFRRREWEDMLQEAGISKYRIRWQWAFRYLIIVDHEQH